MMDLTSPFIISARWSLGFLLLIFGANGILHFIPVPPNPPRAEVFRKALVGTGYMLPLWKSIVFIGAILLLTNLWVPFALVILAPVLVNIFLFHLFLSKRGLWLALILVSLEVLLAWVNRDAYRMLFI